MQYERLKLWLDFFKWFIVSVILFLITTNINSGFRDREITIQETEHYNTYIELITKSTKLDERRELALFFSIVTVSKPIRKRWKKYFEIADEAYNANLRQTRKQLEEKKRIEAVDLMNKLGNKKVQELEKQIVNLNNQLKNKPAIVPVSTPKPQPASNEISAKEKTFLTELKSNVWVIVHKNVGIENNELRFMSNSKLTDIGKSKDIDSEISFWELRNGVLTLNLNNGYCLLTVDITKKINNAEIEGTATTKKSHWNFTMKIKKEQT